MVDKEIVDLLISVPCVFKLKEWLHFTKLDQRDVARHYADIAVFVQCGAQVRQNARLSIEKMPCVVHIPNIVSEEFEPEVLLRAFPAHRDERYRVVLSGHQFKEYVSPDTCVDLSSRVPGATLAVVNGLGTKPDPFSAGRFTSLVTFSFHGSYESVKVLRHVSLPSGLNKAYEAALNQEVSDSDDNLPELRELQAIPDKTTKKHQRKKKSLEDGKRRRSNVTSSKGGSDCGDQEETESEPERKVIVTKVKKEKKARVDKGARGARSNPSSAPTSSAPTPEPLPQNAAVKKRPRSSAPRDECHVPSSRVPSPPPLLPFDLSGLNEPELQDDLALFSRKLRLMSVQQLSLLQSKLTTFERAVAEEIGERFTEKK